MPLPFSPAVSQALALAVAALIAAFLHPLPVPAASISSLVLASAWLLGIPLVSGIFVALVLSRSRRALNWPLLSTAVWFGPLAILTPMLKLPALLIGAVHLTAALASQPLYPHRLLSVAAAILLHATAALILLSNYVAAAVSAMLPVAMITGCRAPISGRAVSMFSISAAVLLASLGVIGRLTPQATDEPGFSPFADVADAPADSRPGTGGAEQDAHSGVILLPPKPEYVRLIVPPSSYLQSLNSRTQEPVRIPFSGVYWMYQAPNRRPPVSSVTEHGIPTERTYRSNDRKSLLMDAHQHLGQHVDLACCRAIEVEISNRDPWARAIQMELILWDTGHEKKPFLSLGTLPLRSTPTLGAGHISMPVAEMLTFLLPAVAPLRQFDAFSIRFHQPASRRDHSAHLAIVSFVLLPHGR